MNLLLVLFILVNFIIVVGMYGIGSFLLNGLHLSAKHVEKNHFISLVAGYISLVVFTAIIVTKGITSYVALAPIVAYLIHTKRNRANNNKREWFSSLKDILPILFVFVFITTLLQFYIYTGFCDSGNFIPEIHNDYIFYSNVSAHLIESAQENYYLNSNISGLFLYHYSEMYLTIISHFFKQGPFIQSYLFSTVPILFTLVSYGFYSVATILLNQRRKFFILLFSVFGFFLAPIKNFVYPFQTYLKGDIYDLVFASYYKLAIILLFVLALFHTINNSQYRIIILIALGIIYPTVLPAVLGMLVFFFLLERINKKAINRTFLFSQLFVLVILMLMLFFFKVYDLEKSSVGFLNLYIGDVSSYIKTLINIAGSSIFKMILTTLPFIFLILLNIKSIIKNGHMFFIVHSLLFQLFGLFAWGLLFRMPDSVQLWFNVFLPVVSVIMFLVLLYSINDPRYWVKVIGSFIIISNVILHFPFEKKYSVANQQQRIIINKIQSSPTASFAFIRNPSEYQSVFDKNVSFGIIGGYLSYYNQSFAPICINTTEIPIETEWERGFVNSTPFSRWAKGKKEPLEKLQLAFIKEHNIRYVLISNASKIPALVLPNVVSVLKDSSNYFQLVELKP